MTSLSSKEDSNRSNSSNRERRNSRGRRMGYPRGGRSPTMGRGGHTFGTGRLKRLSGTNQPKIRPLDDLHNRSIIQLKIRGSGDLYN